MFCKLNSCATVGLNAQLVEVEVDVSKGDPKTFIVGLGDTAVQEAKSRIRLAIKNSGFTYPYTRRIVINLAPADMKKEGASFDLAMAVGVVVNLEKIEVNFDDSIIIGEVSLEGCVRPTTGILPAAIFAKENGFSQLFLPKENEKEAALIKGLKIFPVSTLAH